ncbi:MAG: polysaccharide biosynthesis/export family protein [bacterium]
MIKILLCFLITFNPVLAAALEMPFIPAGVAEAMSAIYAPKEYRVAVGDIISINVFPAQEFSREITVQPDGTIEMPLVGSMAVKDLTTSEIQEKLTQRLSKFISNPQITVNVRRFALRQVFLIGDVRAPGGYDYRDGMKLLDLVAKAGGLDANARTSRVKVFRQKGQGQDENSSFTVNFKAVLDGDMDRDITLSAGDIIFVPRKPFSVTAKWLADNFVPWAILGTFAITVGIVSRK